MQHLPIWYIGNIAHEKCDALVSEFAGKATSTATIGVDGDGVNSNVRDTAVVFLRNDHEFGVEMMATAFIGNVTCKWGYEVDDTESVQFAKYGVGQHYNWHTDTFTLSGKPKDRKITVVALLNDPSEFEGGAFEIKLYDTYTAPLTKGSVIAFPSILEHRVTPVLSGMRYSATMWLNGPRFK